MHPYLFFGIGSRFWTTYRIENGIAYTETWPSATSSIPLNGAKFELSNSILPFGNIIIRNGGEYLELTKVKGRKRVLAALDRARIGQDPEVRIVPTEIDKTAPPTGVKFSDEVLILKSVPVYFNQPLYQIRTMGPVGFTDTTCSSEQWISAGTHIKSWVIPQHPDGCIWCSFDLHKAVKFSLYSPASGWVMRSSKAITCSPDDDDNFLMSQMLVLLLPKEAGFNGIRDTTYDQFITNARKYQHVLFGHKNLVERFGESGMQRYFSENRINEELMKLGSRELQKCKLSELPEYSGLKYADYFTNIYQALKKRFPHNFD